MPPKSNTNIPHHHEPVAQSATAPPKNAQDIINLKIFDIICNTINKWSANIRLFAR